MNSTLTAQRMSAYGLSVAVPRGWDARIFLRRPDGWEDGQDTQNPVLHLATYPLDAVRGDFGGGVVENMRLQDMFIALVEYDREAASTPLFARSGVPRRLRDSWFSPQSMHRPVLGQTGTQLFCNESGRAFCLYLALGSHRYRTTLMTRAEQVLATLRVEARR